MNHAARRLFEIRPPSSPSPAPSSQEREKTGAVRGCAQDDRPVAITRKYQGEIPKVAAIAAIRLEITRFADIFVSMKTLSKRELVRNPSLASHLKPGQSLQLEDGKEPLVVSRRKRARLTAEQIHAELDRLCKDAPAQDALRDLRQ